MEIVSIPLPALIVTVLVNPEALISIVSASLPSVIVVIPDVLASVPNVMLLAPSPVVKVSIDVKPLKSASK